jgi:hypothetical protein
MKRLGKICVSISPPSVCHPELFDKKIKQYDLQMQRDFRTWMGLRINQSSISIYL